MIASGNNIKLFVDDDSQDKSGMELERLQGADQAVRVFKLAAHQGQYKALEEGFRQARGEIVIWLWASLLLPKNANYVKLTS